MIQLSVIIPARNEMWLGHTVRDVLAHSSEATEVIVVLDGSWPVEPLEQHDRLQVVHVPEPIGQRAATNLGARLSTAPWIMKLDAHCSMGEGFDQILLNAAQELGEDVTQIPMQDNLHAFDWICDSCGRRTDQGPTPTACAQCQGAAHHRELVWQRRRGVRTTSWRFDGDLKFQYWGEYSHRPEAAGDFPETLSCLGACWFINRARFWQLGGLDEQHGSWGQMGTEVSCLSWLSGGRMVCNKRTTFAHMFRTQGGDFGFPYPLSGQEVETARKYSRALWREQRWPHQVRPLSWLIDHFAPVPGWARDEPLVQRAPFGASTPTIGLVYYSDCRPPRRLLELCRRQLLAAAPGVPIISVTLAPVSDFGRNVVLSAERGPLTMFQQILAGLEALGTDVAFLVEHDVLYHASHFEYRPADAETYHYNQHTWKVDVATGRALHYRCNQTSGLCADRQLLLQHYRTRVARVEREGFTRAMGFEPGTHKRPRGCDDYGHRVWFSRVPNIDLRHAYNLTASRWSRDQFRNQKFCEGWTEADAVPGWGITLGRMSAFLGELHHATQQAVA